MKRIWFVQQQPFDFMPLKAGLGIITEKELEHYNNLKNLYPETDVGTLCPKIYTTRTRRMMGEYQVVQGSRFKAKPLDPPIQFKVVESFEIDFKSESLLCCGESLHLSYLNTSKYTLAELDLGIDGTTTKKLHSELLRLNKKATVDTTFYINKLEPID